MQPLSELLREVPALDAEAVVYAQEPWAADSAAVCADADTAVISSDGVTLAYLLEVALVREVAEVWSA